MTTATQHIVDCDADPNMLDGYFEKVFKHKKMGQLELDFSRIKLYLPPNYEEYKILGIMWQKELHSMPILNANVLDYLMKHQDLIPESWKGNKKDRDASSCALYIDFLGTIYFDECGRQNVRLLGWHWEDQEWVDTLVWLDSPVTHRTRAAMLETQPSLFSN